MQTIDILISLVLALIMFGIGTSLRLVRFKKIFAYPKQLLVGLGLQMLFLPVLALVIALLSDLPPELQLGLFIVAICPGGATSNFISFLARADTALSVSLTSVNSLLVLVTIPLFTAFGVAVFTDAPSIGSVFLWGTFVQVLLVVILPAMIGMVFNKAFPRLAISLKRPIKITSTVLLALVFTIKYFADQQSGGSGMTMQDIKTLLPSTLLLHLISILFSYFLAKRLSINNFQATTIGIEVGLQNTALALMITGTLMKNNEMTKPALVFSIFSFFTTLAFALLAMKYGKGRKSI